MEAKTGQGRQHTMVRLAGLAAVLLVLVALSLLLGSTRLSPVQVVRAVLAGDWKNTDLRIFLYVRLPRTLGGILCGCGLAVAGAVLQVVLNNSLAGPNIIGVNAGAGFASLVVMALFPRAMELLPAAAFAGALACSLLIYGVARWTGASRMTLILAGVAVTSVVNAASACLRYLFPDILAAYNSFSVGTLNGVTMGKIYAALPYLAAGLAAAFLLSGDMNVLALGEEMARSLGLKVERCRLLLILTAAVLAGASVSFAGLIGFVGLLVPHAARILLGSDNRTVVAGAALLGAGSVLLCDLLGRVVFAPYELPVGVVLSLVGGVGFVALLFAGEEGSSMIECIGLGTGYAGTAVSRQIDLTVQKGELLSLIGPNGCGKTTLLRTMAGLLPTQEGTVRLEGRELREMSERELAQSRAYLPQLRETPDITVGALVAHGRFPYLGFSRQMTTHDREQVDRAMEITGVTGWRHKKLRQLSGGQRQRVYLTMTVAQDTPVLLWDEPATYLDVGSRLDVMELARRLNESGKTVVMTLHDLSDALTLSDRVCLMDGNGRTVMTATPGEVFQSGAIDRVFSVRTERVRLSGGRVSYVFAPERG